MTAMQAFWAALSVLLAALCCLGVVALIVLYAREAARDERRRTP